jgi:hypothetical protein
MSKITLDTLVSRADGFSTAPVNDELMMLNVEQGSYYSLDPIAAEIWMLLEQPARVNDLVNQLQKKYNVSPEQCQADVLAFLGELHGHGMILLQP